MLDAKTLVRQLLQQLVGQDLPHDLAGDGDGLLRIVCALGIEPDDVREGFASHLYRQLDVHHLASCFCALNRALFSSRRLAFSRARSCSSVGDTTPPARSSDCPTVSV